MKDSPGSVWFTLDGKPYHFANTLEAQEYLDTLPSRGGIEFIQAPLLFQLLNAPGAPFINLREIAAEIDAEFGRASGPDKRAVLLQTFKAVMDVGESVIRDEKQLSEFKSARANHYHLLIMQESLIDGYICVDILHEVTAREIAAGRMQPDHKLRKIAEEEIVKPHFTKDELLQGAARKVEEQSVLTVPPKSTDARQSIWQKVLKMLRAR